MQVSDVIRMTKKKDPILFMDIRNNIIERGYVPLNNDEITAILIKFEDDLRFQKKAAKTEIENKRFSFYLEELSQRLADNNFWQFDDVIDIECTRSLNHLARFALEVIIKYSPDEIDNEDFLLINEKSIPKDSINSFTQEETVRIIDLLMGVGFIHSKNSKNKITFCISQLTGYSKKTLYNALTKSALKTIQSDKRINDNIISKFLPIQTRLKSRD